MASVEVMTACENVCRDFWWIGDWLEKAASNPVWALILGGGISLWIWRRQTKLSFELEAKREKRLLYRSYINQIGKSIRAKYENGTEDWSLHPEVRKLWAIQAEISLIGCRSVAIESKRVRDAVETHLNTSDDDAKIAVEDGQKLQLDAYVKYRVEKMLRVMRSEI